MKAKFSISLIIALLFLSTLSVCFNIAPVPVYASAPNWNITGTWALVFTLLPGGSTYPHTMTVTSFDTSTGSFSGTGTGTAALITQLDLKPGSYPNSINLGDNGLLPVAILGSATFHVEQIDPSTILIGGAGVLATRGKAQKLAYSIEDVNGDGYPDMMLFFSIPQLVTAVPLTPTTTSLTVTGYLLPAYGGTAITGTDTVNIVPP
jgi:hypothetical protein